MNREQKLAFIKQHYLDLYEMLKERIPNTIENIWEADLEDIASFNYWVSFYCGRINKPDLMKTLQI